MKSVECEVLAALDKLVLERLTDGLFARRGLAPAWLHRLRLGALEGQVPVRIDEVFPLLEVFLVDAETAWAEEDGCAKSDTWTETAEDGEEVHLEATAVRVGGTALLVVSRDERLFSERRLVLQRARELRMAHDALSREIERRDVLVHCVVHDLAGPLNAILGALSILEESHLSAADAEMVRVGLEAAMRQRGLIREILDVFASERGAGAARPGGPPPDLRAAVSAAAAALTAAVRGRRVALEVSLPQAAECRVFGEEGRLQRVLGNLLENATKHSPPGGTVRVELTDGPREARVTVEDEGPGVTPDVLPKLFQKFGRGSDRLGGTGLGLYFCKITVERWGGAIGYEPRDGGGARFWFWLPKAEVHDAGP